MAKLKLTDAAEIMQRTYDGTNGAEVEVSLNVAGVQAVFLKDRTLVIPGTNEFADWLDFNFNLVDPTVDAHGFTVVPGDSGVMYHAGFLAHAQMVYSFAKALKPKFIIGHSLGAASAQIVGMSLKTPTVAFASPMVVRGAERMPGEGWVVNICRSDDAVCHVPSSILGFRHIGSRYWISPQAVHQGEDHRIDKYIALLGVAAIGDALPKHWPT